MKAPWVSGLERSAPDRPDAPGSFQLSAEDKRVLTHMFLETSHEDLQLLECALLGAQPGEVLHRVHRLHGAALTAGATPMLAELESFERVLREAAHIPTDSQERLIRLRQQLAQYQQR
ncbi:Hpt domain-containing protein [Pseudomonas baltica]|uniref:Hpt domain-containing protein n=1 Tax=Pseudomonas baltica TaxID=2762576 RepID=UPI00289C64AB|nr:Hpt domain-containing protein [Pseudomonas baltica]